MNKFSETQQNLQLPNLDQDYDTLRNWIEQYEITRTNFVILIAKVVDYYYKGLGYDSKKSYGYSVALLEIYICNLKGFNKNEKNYLSNQVPKKVNHFLLLGENVAIFNKKRKANKQKTKIGSQKISNKLFLRKKSSELDVREITDQIYSKILKMIVLKDLQIMDMANHLIEVTTNIIKFVNKFPQLNDLEKKRIIIKVFHLIIENLDDIFDEIGKDDINFLKMTVEELPDVIDVIIAITTSKLITAGDVAKLASKILPFLGKLCVMGCGKKNHY